MPFEITRPLEQLQAEAIARINARAFAIITVRLPLWKQANLTARAVELQAIGQSAWTPAELAEWDGIQAEWNWVKAVRAQSSLAAANVESASGSAAVYQAEKAFLSIDF